MRGIQLYFLGNDAKAVTDSLKELGLAGGIGIPTINGHSGWFPFGWDLHRFDADYPYQARTYAVENHLESGFCSVDFRTGEWQPVDARDGNGYQLGETITFGQNGNSGKYKGKGWSYSEQLASWTEYQDATLLLKMSGSPSRDVSLHAEVSGFTLPAHPRLSFSLLMNGTQVGSFDAARNAARFPVNVTVPASLFRAGHNILTFHIDNPISAAALGLSPDMRLLGVAVYSLRLDERP